MYKFLLLLGLWFISVDCRGQTTFPAFPDTPTITNEGVGKAKIYMKVKKLKQLYAGCTFEPRKMVRYGPLAGDKEDVGLCVKFKGQELFVAGVDHDEVCNIIVLNKRYRNFKGLHVGSTDTELKIAFPDATVFRREIQIVEASAEESVCYIFKNSTARLGKYDKGVTDKWGIYYQAVELHPIEATVDWIIVTAPPI